MMKRKARKGKLWGRFFSKDRFHENVVLNFMRYPKRELAAYGRSYHEAAQHLAKRVAESHYRDLDAAVYAIGWGLGFLGKVYMVDGLEAIGA
jgi:hypothetical protein